MTKLRSKPITYEQVAMLCDGLVARGCLPSKIAVREVWRSSGGGLTTVSKFVGRWKSSAGLAVTSRGQTAVTPPTAVQPASPSATGYLDYHETEVCRLTSTIEAMTALMSDQSNSHEREVISLRAQNGTLANERDVARGSEAAMKVRLTEADVRWEEGLKLGRQYYEHLLEANAELSVLKDVLTGLVGQLTPPRSFDRNPVFRAAKHLFDHLHSGNSDDE